MRKIFKSLIIFVLLILIINIPVFAMPHPNKNVGKEVYQDSNPEATNIELSYNGIRVEGKEISEDNTQDVYLTEKTDNGGSSEEAKDANIKIDYIINIQKEGTYEITGALNDCQIAINGNKIEEQVELILNNVHITCNDAPAIFVYCKDYINSMNKVKITLAEGTVNSITGYRIKESVIGWTDQEEIIYSIQKGYDTKDRENFEEYKYNGAISSDLELIFDGKGTLNVTSYKKEGIEVKSNIRFFDGVYNIIAMDDAINACADYSIVEINGGTLLTKVFREAEEGDGIDSNGSIIINGGNVYAFSYDEVETGLDTIEGVMINGGKVFILGYAEDSFESEFDQKIIDVRFDRVIKKGEKVVVVDQDENPILGFVTDRDFQTLVYSSEDLNFSTYKTYVGNEIPEGLSYQTMDLNLKAGKEIELVDLKFTNSNENINNKLNINKYAIVSIVIIVIVVIIFIILFLKRLFSKGGKK